MEEKKLREEQIQQLAQYIFAYDLDRPSIPVADTLAKKLYELGYRQHLEPPEKGRFNMREKLEKEIAHKALEFGHKYCAILDRMDERGDFTEANKADTEFANQIISLIRQHLEPPEDRLEVTYTLICDKCGEIFYSSEALPSPPLCPTCKVLPEDRVEALNQLLAQAVTCEDGRSHYIDENNKRYLSNLICQHLEPPKSDFLPCKQCGMLILANKQRCPNCNIVDPLNRGIIEPPILSINEIKDSPPPEDRVEAVKQILEEEFIDYFITHENCPPRHDICDCSINSEGKHRKCMDCWKVYLSKLTHQICQHLEPPAGSLLITKENEHPEEWQKPSEDRVEEVIQKVFEFTSRYISAREARQICQLPEDRWEKLREAIAVEYRKAVEESEAKPFGVENLDYEHKILWRGHASAYSEVISYIDNQIHRHLEP